MYLCIYIFLYFYICQSVDGNKKPQRNYFPALKLSACVITLPPRMWYDSSNVHQIHLRPHTCNKCARESLDVCGGISNILKFVFPLSSNADKSVERVCKILINADIWDLGAIVEAELRTKRIFCIYIYIYIGNSGNYNAFFVKYKRNWSAASVELCYKCS